MCRYFLIITSLFSLFLTFSCSKSDKLTLPKENSSQKSSNQEELSPNKDISYSGETSYGVTQDLNSNSGSSSTSIPEEDIKESTTTGNLLLTNIIESGTTTLSGTSTDEGMMTTGSQIVIKGFDSTLGFEPNNIRNIKTVEELKILSPSITISTENDNPKYIELQKDQMLLSVYLAQIKDEGFRKLRQEEMDIYQGKEIWPSELREADGDFLKMLNDNRGKIDYQNSDEYKKRNILMREFQETMEYKEYISKSQMRLTEIQASMKTYYSKDVVKLSEEIDSLKKEIFKR